MNLYGNYLSRPNVKQPILTQYCDGRRVTCPNWMSQWGSSELGAQGYDAIDIIRYYYGDNMYINVAEDISGVPSSWPGYNLEIGSSGSKVLQMQEQLNKISTAYPAIPQITAGWNIRRGNCKCSKNISENIWASTDRSSRLSDMV